MKEASRKLRNWMPNISSMMKFRNAHEWKIDIVDKDLFADFSRIRQKSSTRSLFMSSSSKFFSTSRCA